MGLDNIPKEYPCKKAGSAVLMDDKIDCNATQACGGCPWKNANPPDGAVYGMFGTDCWYRGKWGNYLLERATVGDPMGDNLDFYGDNDDGSEKSPESCLATASVCRQAWESYTPEEIAADTEVAEIVYGLKYAEWYLRWAAETTNGLVCWF